VLHEVNNTRGVTVLVIIPGDKLDQVGVEHDTGISIKDGDKGGDGDIVEPHATWAGVYVGEGGDGGTWGNGGRYDMVIKESGELEIKGVEIPDYEFDPQTKKLVWSLAGVHVGQVQFTIKSVSFNFWNDKPGNTCEGQCFTGFIQINGKWWTSGLPWQSCLVEDCLLGCCD
jgi:hypothetical protein